MFQYASDKIKISQTVIKSLLEKNKENHAIFPWINEHLQMSYEFVMQKISLLCL
jgi:hypothetical protein